MRPRTAGAVLACVLLLLATLPNLRAQIDEQLVRSYLWPQSDAEFALAAAALRAAPWAVGASRADMHTLEEVMRAGPPVASDVMQVVGDVPNEFVVSTPGGRSVSVWVRLPVPIRRIGSGR